MQDVGQSSSHVLFCTYRSREYRTVIRNVLLFENLMYSKLLSQNVAKKQCIGKKNCHEAKNHHWTTNMNLDHGATHLDLGTIKAQGSLDKRGPMKGS